MMVRVPMYPEVTTQRRRYWFEQTRDRQDHLDTNEEYELLLNWVKDPARPEQPPSRKLTEDDPFILKQITSADSSSAFCIVTDDIKLCREAHQSTRKWICRIPCKWYFMSTYFGEGDSPWEAILQRDYPIVRWETIIDTGSIESYEELGFRDGVPIKWPVKRPFVMTKPSITPSGKRVRSGTTEVVEEEDLQWTPYRFPEGYLFTRTRLYERRKHPHARGMA